MADLSSPLVNDQSKILSPERPPATFGQCEVEDCPARWIRLIPDPAPVMVHDPLANSQPDTMANIMAVPMKTTKNVKDVVGSFFDTYTVVGY